MHPKPARRGEWRAKVFGVASANGAKWDERHGRWAGIATWEECLAVERSGQLPRYKAGHFRSLLNSSFCLFPFCTDHRGLAPEAVVADYAGTRDGAAYQSLHRADRQGAQRNLPEGLFVLLEIKKSAGMMAGFCYLDTHHFCELLPSYSLRESAIARHAVLSSRSFSEG